MNKRNIWGPKHQFPADNFPTTDTPWDAVTPTLSEYEPPSTSLTDRTTPTYLKCSIFSSALFVLWREVKRFLPASHVNHEARRRKCPVGETFPKSVCHYPLLSDSSRLPCLCDVWQGFSLSFTFECVDSPVELTPLISISQMGELPVGGRRRRKQKKIRYNKKLSGYKKKFLFVENGKC